MEITVSITRTIIRYEICPIASTSAHMRYNFTYFDCFCESNDNEVIRIGNNVELHPKGRGNVKIQKFINGE